MPNWMFWTAASGVALAAVTAVAFWSVGTDVLLTRTFGVAQQNARTQVFRQSDAYRAGRALDLQKLVEEYRGSSTPEAKAVVLNAVRHVAATTDPEAVPADVTAFLQAHSDE